VRPKSAAPQELYNTLAQQLDEGKPGHCHGTYYVRANKFFHVPASTEVSTCVCKQLELQHAGKDQGVPQGS
jgi:hypothetical protein